MATPNNRAARDAAIARLRSSGSRGSRDAAIARIRNKRGVSSAAMLGITADRARRQSTPVGDALGTVAGSVLDYVSRPAYMVADVLQGDVKSLGKNALNLVVPGSQSIERLAGSRDTVSQALEQKGVRFGGGIPGFAGRFAVDVITDPLTYLTFGTASGLKGASQIGRSAMGAAVASGASSPRAIARAQRLGAITPEQAKVERIRTSAEIGAKREQATAEYLAGRGGQGVVAGVRIPVTAVRAINRVAGTNLKPVVPLVESKRLARGLDKAGLNISGARGVPTLRAIFAAAGGEDMGAYQSYLAAMNTVNQHKAEFARDSRNIERAVLRSGRAAGIRSADASPTASHLYEAPDVARRAKERAAELQARISRATDEVEAQTLAAQIEALPTDTRSAYEWLRQNNNHGGRFQFPEYDVAVRAFGSPDEIADDTIMGIIQSQSRKYEDYADAAGVLYDKIDRPYLTQLPANREAREQLDKLAETVTTRRGEIRKMQEGFTRHRKLPTLMDWYLAEAELGVKMVPELSVGRRLTVRGVSGASEAMHAVLMREFVKMYGARGPLPDMDELEDALRRAVAEAEDKNLALDKLLNRSSSPIAKQAQSDYARLRRERVAARAALTDAKKKAKQVDPNVSESAIVVAAQKRLDDIEAQIDAIKSQPRVSPSPVADLDGARASRVAEATKNLNIAQADRAAAITDMAQRIRAAAIEKIRDVKSRFRSGADEADDAPGVFATPEAEAEALRNEELNQARQEVVRLENILGNKKSVPYQVARWMKSGRAGTRAAAKKKREGMQDPKIQLGKERAKLKRMEKSGADIEDIAEQAEWVDWLEKGIENDRASGGSGVASINDLAWSAAGNDKRRLEAAQVRGQNAAGAGGKANRAQVGDEDTGKTRIADYLDNAMQFILDNNVIPTEVASPSVKVARAVDQDGWEDARKAINEYLAARSIVDDFEAERLSPPTSSAQQDAEIDAVFGPDPDAIDQFRPVEVPAGRQITGENVPEGDVIPVAGQPSDIVQKTPIDSLPWGQRQVIKTLRKRFGSPPDMDKSWVSVAPGERGFRIRVGGKKGTVTVSNDELLEMEQAGWLDARLDKDGQINGIKPGPELQAEGRAMSEVEGAVKEGMTSVLQDVGTREVRIAEEALRRAESPVTREQRRIAQLEANLRTAREQGRANVVAARELSNLKSQKKAARERVQEAKRQRQSELVAAEQQLYDELLAAEDALRQFIGLIKRPPNARKVAAATRKRDRAVKSAQKAENKYAEYQTADDAARAYVQSLYRADASYDEAMRATGFVRNDPAEWARLQDEWVSFSDRNIPRSTTLDPNAGVVFDPAIAPQIERVLDRINPAVKSQTALRKTGQFVIGITRAWKGLVLATPGYHLRNMIDDGLRAYWAGARNPASFFQAVRIMQGKATTIKIRGQVYTSDEILSMANTHGIIGTGSQYHSEVGPAYERQGGRRFLRNVPLPRVPSKGVVVTTSQQIGEMRENMTRLGTFIELMKNGEDQVTAAKNTRDFLFDYNDISQFISVAKNFWSPFITYSLKAAPFYAKTLVQRPGQLANLNLFMRDMTATAAQDYPGDVTMEYMAPGQELSFALPRIPGVSDALFGEGKPGAVDPSNLIGLSSINQLSPITFPQPAEGESAIGAALGTIPRGVGRVAAGFGNPLARYGVELATQQDMRFGSPLPNRTRLTPVPMAAQRLLSAVSGGNLNLPGYGMKTDAYSGEQVEGASTNFLRALNLFPPISQAGSYATVTGGFGFDNPFVNESDAGRISFVRTFTGVPIRPLDVSRAQYFATRRQ